MSCGLLLFVGDTLAYGGNFLIGFRMWLESKRLFRQVVDVEME